MRCIVIWSVSCSPTWTSFPKCMQRVRSTPSHICMSEGISGVLNVDQCNMEIQSISVAVVQQETISEIV